MSIGIVLIVFVPVGNYMLKVNNRNTRTRYEICSKLTIQKLSREINKQKDRLVRASQAVIRNFLICIGDISKNQFGLLVFEKAKITFNESKRKKLFKMQIYRDDFVSYPERP